MEIALTTRVPLLCRSRILSPSSLRIASRSGVREMLSCRERRVSRITSFGLSSRERSMSTTFAYATAESERLSGGWDRLAAVFDFGWAPRTGNDSSARLVVRRFLFRKIPSAHDGLTPSVHGRSRVHYNIRLQFHTTDGIHYGLVTSTVSIQELLKARSCHEAETC